MLWTAPPLARMQAITTIGLAIANSGFQVHGVDAEGKVLSDAQRQLENGGNGSSPARILLKGIERLRNPL